MLPLPSPRSECCQWPSTSPRRWPTKLPTSLDACAGRAGRLTAPSRSGSTGVVVAGYVFTPAPAGFRYSRTTSTSLALKSGSLRLHSPALDLPGPPDPSHGVLANQACSAIECVDSAWHPPGWCAACRERSPRSAQRRARASSSTGADAPDCLNALVGELRSPPTHRVKVTHSAGRPRCWPQPQLPTTAPCLAAQGDTATTTSVPPPPVLLARLRRALMLRRGGRQRNLDRRASEIQAALRDEQLAAPDVGRGLHCHDCGGGGDHRPAQPPSPPSRRASKAVLSNTRTPPSTSPCQDSVMCSAPECSARSGMTPIATPAPSFAETTPERHPLGQEAGGVGPPRAQPPSLRRRRPVGLLLPVDEPGLSSLLRPAASRWRSPSPGATGAGNRLVGILHGCLRSRSVYDEHTAWAHRCGEVAAA